VLLLDEPTNHMDMESIESLNIALDKYAGTLIFVSHDREFVSSLATRILEIKEDHIIDFQGNYEDEERFCELHHPCSYRSSCETSPSMTIFLESAR
jgi:ATPase subunit of ABC transporter with duplicated ATPase domains